ncbi:MAG: N-acetylglucosaminyl-phosphatidylinositol de-N-acetylase family protein Est14A [uncultured bacterium]|nr:MAG: N-acetylglucosaminyl-phosphatidylinositol de-N-acetylase family protein Est14A [uncultured bacterium]
MGKLIDFKKLYQKFLFADRLLKIARIFHFEKLSGSLFELESADKCLILSPHPDDETVGCAGLLLKYPQNFDIICVTDGRCGSYDHTPEETTEIRRKEFEAAMARYGISSYSFLNIEDRKLINNYSVFKSLDIADYDYIFLPNYFDQNKDHKAVTVLLQKLLLNKKYKNNLKIVFYEVWSALPLPNYFFNISDVVESKKELINLYQSQVRYVSFVESIIGLNKYRGMQSNCHYAEAFSIMDVRTFMKL